MVKGGSEGEKRAREGYGQGQYQGAGKGNELV